MGSSSNSNSRPKQVLVLFLVSDSNSRLCGNCRDRTFVSILEVMGREWD